MAVLVLSVSVSAVVMNGDAVPALKHTCEASGAVAVLSLMFSVHLYYEEAKKIVTKFEKFTLSEAECVSEDDKHTVMEYIDRTWSTSADAGDGCDVFTRFVKEELSVYVKEEFLKPAAVVKCLLSNSIMVLLWQAFFLLVYFANQIASPDKLIGHALKIVLEFCGISADIDIDFDALAGCTE